MTLNTYRNNPEYPDRFSRNKNWRKILPVKGRPIQTAEMTELQSILQDNIKQGFDTLFTNGTPIKGLRVSVSSRDFNNVTVSISSGQIYIEGTVLDVLPSTLIIPTDSIYNIVVIITETIFTEVEDASLRDPIKGAFIQGTPGASRLVWSTSLGFNPPEIILNNSYAIAQVVNGVILQKDLNPFYEIERLMSQFIFERNGNFCVNGFEVTSLGLERRSNSSITKFDELQLAVSNAENTKQDALSNLVTFQTLVTNLTQQVQQAQITASISPTAQNNATLANLQIQLAEAQTQFSNFSTELATAQIQLDSASTALNNAESLLTDQQIIGVAPGVCYIEGFRVAINSPSRLFIPQALPTSSVEAATFTFRGIISQSLRSFSLTGTSTLQTTEQYVSLEIDFTNLDVNPNVTPILTTNSFNISILYKIQDPTPLVTIITNILESITLPTLDNIDIEYKLYDNEVAGTPELTQDASGNPLTKEVIKNLLNQYIETITPTTTSLLFSATNFTLAASSINIAIDSKVYLKLDDTLINNISNLTVNIPSQTLSQPISNSTYQLAFRPVIKVNRLIANLQTSVTVIRDENDLVDSLVEDSVVRIDLVTQTVGNVTTTFSPANYYATQTGIGWRIGATAIPAAGTAYQVTFIYTEPLVENSDFILDNTTDTIEFIGRTPVINDTFLVEYSYSLAKAGVITLDKDGKLSYVLSAPARNPVIPIVPDSRLSLASFNLYSNRIEIQQLDCRRQTVADLFNLAERIKQNTFNNQILRADIISLNEALSEGADPIGVFSDSYVNLDKLDLRLTNAAIVPGVQAFMNSYVRFEEETNYIIGNTTATIVDNEMGSDCYAILPFTETKFFSQPRSTKIREVTRIPSTINKRARLYIDTPFIFLNTETTALFEGSNIQKVLTKVSPCDPITRAGNFFIAANEQSQLIKNIVLNVRNILGPFGSDIMNSFQTGVPIVIPNTDNFNDPVVKAFNDYKVTPISLEVHAEGLPPMVRGFKIFLDGVKWHDYTRRAGTASSIGDINALGDGVDGFTVKADGTVDLTIHLPSEMPTGTHTIEIKQDGWGYSKANFYVYNTLLNHLILTPLRTWNATPITTSASNTLPLIPADVISEDLNLLGIDPSLNIEVIDNTVTFQSTTEAAYPTKQLTVNQTFVPNEDYFITRVDLKIASAPTGADNELFIMLTDTNQQIPIKQIRGITTPPLAYNITSLSNGDPGTYTSFNFSTPQYIQRNTRYNIGLESYIPSVGDNFSVYTAVADDIDISSNSIIGEQLFIDGALFTSSDGSSIEFQNKEDLTLDIYRANFANSAVLDMGSYAVLSPINFFCLNTRDIIPIGTEIIYEYRITGGSTWIPFKANTVICLNSAVAGIDLRANLNTNFLNLTPMVLLNKSSITIYSTQGFSTVASTQVTYPTAYRKITLVMDYIQPANTDLEVFYSPNDGFAWQGPEWLELHIVPGSTILLDSALQIYRSTFIREESTLIYILNEERVKFRYRVNLHADLNGVSPLIKNIQTFVE